MDPLSTNLTHMFCELFQDALTEYTYAAELAGLGYNINNTIYGLTVSFILMLTVSQQLYDLNISVIRPHCCVVYSISGLLVQVMFRVHSICSSCLTRNHFTALLESVRDHPGEQAPER